jgi:hypothetical protein
VSHSSFACDLFCALSRGLVYISNANPACSCVYICKFQFRPIHPPSRRLSLVWHIINSLNMCWTLNHQNIIEMTQRHISLSISPFLVIYANTSKSNKNKCNIDANKDQIVFDSNLAYLDHSSPPLGLFLQIKFIFLSLSQTHLFRHKERYS